jgi:hypothetical protein
MLNSAQITAAAEYVEYLRLSLHDRDIPANHRVRAAAGCLAIAQDHHHAIVLLLEHRLYASSFSLIRVAFEAYVRGEWLALCASDAEIEQFLNGEEPPKIDRLLSALEGMPAFTEQVLSKIKKRRWKAMCAYTHTGGLHVQRWNTAAAIEPNYSSDEILEVLQFAEIIASLAVLGVAGLMNDEPLANTIWVNFQKRVGI